MTVLPKARMTVDKFLAWAQERPGRYDLEDGIVHAMSPEGAGHAEIKFAVQAALAAAIRVSQRPCHMLPHGMTVRVDETTAYEPDALVYCGAKLPPRAVEVSDPVIVVEALSPSTRRIDASAKLAGYFRLPSVCHYLIVDPNRPVIIHHARRAGDVIATRIVTNGTIALDPPGLTVECATHSLSDNPALPGSVASYLADLASSGAKLSTIRRRCSAIGDAHRRCGNENLAAHPGVKATLEGIARTIGSAPAKKQALTADLLAFLRVSRRTPKPCT